MSDFTLEDLARIVAERARSGDPGSYTAKLAGQGIAQCAKKFGEEAVEAIIAATRGNREGLKAETADVLYHLLVLLEVSGVPYKTVTEELERRTAKTGLEEKAGREGS
jgi:phosphoribosyl-ATP pyrophosphohydrolase